MPLHELTWRIQGDHLQFYYYLWLVRDRLQAGASIFRDPYQFSVNGPHWNLPNTFLPFTLLYLPLSLLGPLLAYNLLVLLSFPLAGLTIALLAHRYGLSRWAALVAGAVFACAPYRLGALLGGHPSGLAYFLVPLALWGLEGALAGSVAGGVWGGVALLSIALVEPHFVYFAALGLPLYVVLRVGLAGWTRDALRIGAPFWALALAVALTPAWVTISRLRQQGWALPVQTRLALGAVVALGVLILWQCAAGGLHAAGAAAAGDRSPTELDRLPALARHRARHQPIGSEGGARGPRPARRPPPGHAASRLAKLAGTGAPTGARRGRGWGGDRVHAVPETADPRALRGPGGPNAPRRAPLLAEAR